MYSPFLNARRALIAPIFLAATAPLPAQDIGLSDRAKLSADRLAAAVLANNPNVAMMESSWRAVQSKLEQVSALEDPMLTYTVAPLTIGAADVDLGFGVELSQKVPWPGKRRLRGDAAAQEADAAEAYTAALRLKLTAAAKGLFAGWYEAHEAIDINRLDRELLEDVHTITETRYGTGTATRRDALRAQVESSLAARRGIQLEAARRRIAARINTLLNRAPDTPLPPPEKLPDTLDLPDAAALQAAARSRRPEIRALSATLHASELRTDLARRESYPDLNLIAGYDSLWERDELRFTVGVGVNLPLNQGKRRAARDEARAASARARWELSDRIAAIAGEVQIAYEGYRENRDALALFHEQLLPLAEDALAAAKADYEAGGGDFLALIDAEKALIATRLEASKSVAGMHRWVAELEGAAGGLDILGTVAGGNDQ